MCRNRYNPNYCRNILFKMKKNVRIRKLLLVLFVGILFSFATIPQSFGHGLGTEILPPIDIGDKKVSLEATATVFEQPEINGRQIQLVLLDMDTRVTINEVTFLLKVTKGNEFLFEHTFQKDDGILVLDLIPSESNKITIEEKSSVGMFESLLGIDSKSTAKGAPFKNGGLYLIELQILTAGDYSDKLKESIKYNFGLSFQEFTSHIVNDTNFGKQEIELIAYYDQLSNFQYDPKTKTLSFKMPFEWSDENIKQSTVVHNEVRFSKTFGDLLTPSYTLYVNNIELEEYVITIDEFSEFYRIVHLIIPQSDLVKLKEIQSLDDMQFHLIPNTDKWPLSTVTANGQFRINLGWEENEIKSGTNITFNFEILDVFLQGRLMSVPYEISLMYNGKTLDTKSGISTDERGKHNSVEFFIPEDVTGPVTLQFENLDSNGLAKVGLPVVVNRIDSSPEVSIPDWVRNNAEWWAAGQIGDSDFASGIEFMIKHGIIIVPQTQRQEGADAIIPEWVRNNAEWWSQRLISDNDFASGLQFLIANGIISV